MSQFNIYARKLDTAFKEARSEYNTAFRALQEAQQASRDANAWKPGDSAEEKQVRTTRAALYSQVACCGSSRRAGGIAAFLGGSAFSFDEATFCGAVRRL